MLEENKRIQETLTLVKFHANTERPFSKNRLITKTLGKHGVVSSDYKGQAPNEEEFWLCGFQKEVTKSTPCSGLFILKPLHYVDRSWISYIPFGYYNIEQENGILYVIPKDKDMYWMMSMADRRRYFSPEVHAIIVVNQDVSPQIAAAGAAAMKEAQLQLHSSYRPAVSDADLDRSLGLDQR